MYSKRCKYNWNAYWDDGHRTCVQCQSTFSITPGFEFSPNCGIDDEGSRHEKPYSPCKPDTFNNGSFIGCQPCKVCAVKTITECNTTVDTQCCGRNEDGCGLELTSGRTSLSSTANTTSVKQLSSGTHMSGHVIGLLTSITVVAVVVLLLLIVFLKRKQKCRWPCRKGRQEQPNCSLITTEDNVHFTNYHATQSQVEKQDTLSPELQTAPLQIVLENLDVLEELVILLDPESAGVKSTAHLASRCSFSSTWITYIYSLRAIQSPLKAVLEGVTTKNPNWTVGHLAQLLKEMDRNDAVAVLSKLSLAQET